VDEPIKAIREAVNSGTALGSARFKDEIEQTLARSVRIGTPGGYVKIEMKRIS
jgi:hypothetical protein